MCKFIPTDRTRVRLHNEFGNYDRDTVYAIIDDAPICHISTVIDGTPYLQATAHWRIDDKIYMHGAVKNKMVKALTKGAEACLAFTHFDGYALARSAYNHAVIYRSVIAFSKGRFVEDLEEKNSILEAFIESVQPDRWKTVRQPTTEELKMTGVVEFELKEVSAKILPQEITPVIFPGGEAEAPEDADYSPWTGVLPYKMVKEAPISSADIPPIAED